MQRVKQTKRLASGIADVASAQAVYTSLPTERTIIHNIVIYNDGTVDAVVEVWAGASVTLAYKIGKESVVPAQTWNPLDKSIVINEGESVWITSYLSGYVSYNVYGSTVLDET